MTNVATGLILTAGTMTFANEWYQTNKVNWRVPVATMLAAAVFDGLAHLDDKAATGLAFIALLGAFTTRFNGQSVADTIAALFNGTATRKPKQSKGLPTHGFG
jgi:hypothetical protein